MESTDRCFFLHFYQNPNMEYLARFFLFCGMQDHMLKTNCIDGHEHWLYAQSVGLLLPAYNSLEYNFTPTRVIPEIGVHKLAFFIPVIVQTSSALLTAAMQLSFLSSTVAILPQKP